MQAANLTQREAHRLLPPQPQTRQQKAGLVIEIDCESESTG